MYSVVNKGVTKWVVILLLFIMIQSKVVISIIKTKHIAVSASLMNIFIHIIFVPLK